MRELLFVNLAGTYFPSKGGLDPSKRGQKPPFEGKKGSRQMYNTETSRPSFPSVLVGKILGKYQPIPNRNTKSGYNSSLDAFSDHNFSERAPPVFRQKKGMMYYVFLVKSLVL
jgi:hypothetical protein